MWFYLEKMSEDDTDTDPVGSILVKMNPPLGLAKMLSSVSWSVFTIVYVADDIIILGILGSFEIKI